MISYMLIAQFVFAVLIVFVVLLQKSSSIGLGAYSGSNESLFGAKGPNAFLAKTTATLGILFVLNSVGLTYLYYTDRNASVVDSVVIDAPDLSIGVPLEDTATPAAPAAPIPNEAQ